MKIKQKKCKACGCDFKPYKSTDKYCSSKCFYSEQKGIQNKPRARIKPISKKQAGKLSKYTKIRRVFLARPENHFCAVCKEEKTTEIHHLAGKVESRLFEPSNFLAVCRWCHTWIHNHPKEAYKRGWLRSSSSN